jgi:long-chain acyl-CoA synthetase
MDHLKSKVKCLGLSTLDFRPGRKRETTMQTIAALVERLAEQFGPRQALLHKPANTKEVWTYAELLDRTNRVAAWLKERGVEKGDRIIIWAPNSPAWVIAYFGALRLGAVVVPLDIRSGADFAERVVGQTEPKVALLSKTTQENWRGSAPVVLLDELYALPETAGSVRDESLVADDIAALMFTSGTTGNPKGVILTHANILANVESVDLAVPNISDFRLVSLLPLSHMFEQTVGLLLALKRGSSVYYISSLLPATIFDALKEQQATAMLLVPAALQLFMSSIEREVAKQGKAKQWELLQRVAPYLPSPVRRFLFRAVHERLGGHLQFVVSGGAPIAPELVKKWETLGIAVIQGYGATEASPVISCTTMADRNPFTVGKALRDVEIKIAEDGEVWIKGPNVTSGYWRNPEATEQAFENGWYKTGDLGSFEKNGHLRLIGRKKDMIALANGQNVYPEDVERVLKGVPGVTDVVVVGMPAEEGATVHAVLICSKDATNHDDIIRQANKRLSPHQYIKSFTVWPETDFPRTHTLKVKKHEVLKSLQTMRGQEEAAAKEKAIASASR